MKFTWEYAQLQVNKLAIRCVWIVIIFTLFVPAADLSTGQAADTSVDKITFLFESGANSYSLYMMDSDGQNVRQVANGVIREAGYSLSPDGNQLLYYHTSREIRILDLETGTEQTVYKQADNNATLNLLTWAPDGRQFIYTNAYSSEDGEGIEVFLKSMDVNTGHLSILFSYVNNSTSAPSTYNSINSIQWMPDGNQLLYSFYRTNQSSPYQSDEEIYLADLDGSIADMLYQFSTTDRGTGHLWLNPSPDQRSILQPTNTFGEVEIVNLDGSQMLLIREPVTPIEARGSDSEYNWTPDGTSVFTVGIGVAGNEAAINRFILRLFDVEQRQWTELIAQDDSGLAPECSVHCISDIRWYRAIPPSAPIVIERLPEADSRTVWTFDDGLDSWTAFVDDPQDMVGRDDYTPAGTLVLFGWESVSRDNDRPNTWIMRKVQLPTDATQLTLVAAGVGLAAMAAGSDYDPEESGLGSVRILLRDETLSWHTLLGWQELLGTEWLTYDSDISAFAGQTVTLSIEQDGPMPAYIDMVEIK